MRKIARFFIRLGRGIAPFQRVGKWMGLVLMMIMALRSAATYFLPEVIPEEEVKMTDPGDRRAEGAPGDTEWWNPENPLVDPTVRAEDSLGDATDSSTGNSLVLIDRSVRLNSSPWNASPKEELAPNGSRSSLPAYVILGLSGIAAPATPPTAGSDSGLHFSLSAQLSAVPTYSISGGALAEPLNLPVPEPATGGVILAAGIAALAVKRHRRAPGRN